MVQMNLFTKQKRVTDVGNHLRVIEWKYLSHVQLFGTPWTIQFMGFSRPETGVGSHLLLQGIFPTQGSVPGLQHCRWILYQMSHKGNPRILELAAHPCSRGYFQHRNQNGVSCFAGGFFTNWGIREAHLLRGGMNWKL